MCRTLSAPGKGVGRVTGPAGLRRSLLTPAPPILAPLPAADFVDRITAGAGHAVGPLQAMAARAARARDAGAASGAKQPGISYETDLGVYGMPVPSLTGPLEGKLCCLSGCRRFIEVLRSNDGAPGPPLGDEGGAEKL